MLRDAAAGADATHSLVPSETNLYPTALLESTTGLYVRTACSFIPNPGNEKPLVIMMFDRCGITVPVVEFSMCVSGSRLLLMSRAPSRLTVPTIGLVT